MIQLCPASSRKKWNLLLICICLCLLPNLANPYPTPNHNPNPKHIGPSLIIIAPPAAHCDPTLGGDPSQPLCAGINCSTPSTPNALCKPTCGYDPTQVFCQPDCTVDNNDPRCTPDCTNIPWNRRCPECMKNPYHANCAVDCIKSPNDPRCTSTPPGPDPPSMPSRHSEKCDMSDDNCDKDFNLVCVAGRSGKENFGSNQGECRCMHGLWPGNGGKSACGIPYDDICGEDALQRLKDLKYNVAKPPQCLRGECTKINGHFFCRPGQKDYSMILSPPRAKKFQGMFGKSRQLEANSYNLDAQKPTNPISKPFII